MKKHISLFLVFAMLLCCIPVGAFAAEDAYYSVAGTGALCGSEWNPSDPANRMTLYEITYRYVPAGTYEFKVTNGTWDQSWGDGWSNYVLEITTESNITITFNPETFEIAVKVAELAYYSVAGTGDLCGAEWNPAEPANRMALNEEGLYEITFSVFPRVIMSSRLPMAPGPTPGAPMATTMASIPPV